jgi:hypothetical protein
MFPCPLTTFAIALVAAAAPDVDKKAFILLLPWALMALAKCFGALDCYEDCILFASGVYGLVKLIRNWKTQQAEARWEPWVQRKSPGCATLDSYQAPTRASSTSADSNWLL